MQFLSSFLSLCLLFSLLLASPVSSQRYCPATNDLATQYGQVYPSQTGWTISGGGRVVTNTVWDLRGGAISFDMDLSQVGTGNNANLYLIAPAGQWDSSQYCDAQGQNGPVCEETDLIESNGNCGAQTSYHHFAGNTGQIDFQYKYPSSGLVHIDVHFSATGNSFTIKGSQQGVTFVNKAMAIHASAISHAVIVSSLWQGWVPDCNGRCSSAVSGGATYTVENLLVYGKPVGGYMPTTC